MKLDDDRFPYQLTHEKIFGLLNKINPYEAVGCDGISPFVLKNAAAGFVARKHIFKLSYESGAVPDEWLRANVSPIHKEGTKTDPSTCV
jgi:hypothetical protein